ncbi:MAG TPA: DUF6152 family protein [Gammaproteobacteria bacterium]
MRKTFLSIAAGAGFMLSAGSALAHHSFAAEFDRNKPVSLEGVVVEFEWVNPHSWLHIDVTKPDGTVERWMIEGGAPSALLRRGWTRDTLPPGTKVQVTGFQAKDGSLRANSTGVVFPDGTSLDLGGTRVDQ